jgi:hypothetical protein
VHGTVPEHLAEDTVEPPPADPADVYRYNTMILNYALECLGSNAAYPVSVVARMSAESVRVTLDKLDWAEKAWGAGDWIDCFASCLYINSRHFRMPTTGRVLFGWLAEHADPDTGLWGQATDAGWLQPVNGFYRLTRGTYAQAGVPLPYPAQAFETILRHAEDACYFQGRGNACNVLDVVHPLWLCLRQVPDRKAQVAAWVEPRIEGILASWVEGEGFPFDLDDGKPSLQGTEMWLSILYLMADVLGIGEALGYRPKGVHRTEPVWNLGSGGRG